MRPLFTCVNWPAGVFEPLNYAWDYQIDNDVLGEKVLLVNSVISKVESIFVKLVFCLFLALSLVLSGCGGESQIESSGASSSDEETSIVDDGGDLEETPEYALELLSQPSNASITEGQSYTFSVSVDHDLPITVTWLLDGDVLSSGSQTSITVDEAGAYGCSISDGEQIVTCSTFNLSVSVLEFVEIVTQPSDQTVDEGVDVVLSVVAAGTGVIGYQWYLDGVAISGATASSLTLEDVMLADAGEYYCVVSNTAGTELSNIAELTVNEAVEQLPVGDAVALNWGVPDTRADGDDLMEAEIAAYEIYHSDTASGAMSLLGSVDSDEQGFTVEGLSVGTHYFALVTVDTNGIKSALSSAISVNVN